MTGWRILSQKVHLGPLLEVPCALHDQKKKSRIHTLSGSGSGFCLNLGAAKFMNLFLTGFASSRAARELRKKNKAALARSQHPSLSSALSRFIHSNISRRRRRRRRSEVTQNKFQQKLFALVTSFLLSARNAKMQNIRTLLQWGNFAHCQHSAIEISCRENKHVQTCII